MRRVDRFPVLWQWRFTDGGRDERGGFTEHTRNKRRTSSV
jgi:hypothetical protein